MPKAMWVVVVVLGGCTAGSGVDAGSGADANPCSATVHPIAQCQVGFGFSAGPDLPKALDHHGTVIATSAAGSFLYVIGGNNYHGVFNTVYMAPIGADGALGAWTTTTPLPAARAGFGIAVTSGRIVVLSGQNNGVFPATVVSAPIQADGTLGAWIAEPSLPEARFHPYVTISGQSLYVTGGLDPTFVATNTVYRSTINSDGTLGAFASLTTLPVTRSHHIATVHDGFLYIAGGITGNPAGISTGLSDVLSAPVLSDGTLGAFSVIGTLDTPPATLSTFELEGQLYLVGGITDNSDYIGDIRRAPFAPNGQLGSFELLSTGLPVGRSHVHQTPFFNNHLYSVGGSIAYEKTTRSVQVGLVSWDMKMAARKVLRPHSALASGPRKPHCPRHLPSAAN